MAIITISRQAGSLSREIAPGIAEKFGWLYIDKDKITTALEKYSIDSDVVDRFDEKKPSFKDSFSLENEKYFNYFKLFFFEKAYESKGCVLLGRGGAFLLDGVPGVLRIRLVSSEKSRIERVMERSGLDEKQAKKIISQSDHERSAFHKYYYHRSWDSPESYDITINTDLFTAETISVMLESLIHTYLKGDFEKQGRGVLNDKLLAQKILVKVLYESEIPVHLFEVEVHDGKATLIGTVEIESMIDKCSKAALIDGVKSLDNKIVFISQYPPII